MVVVGIFLVGSAVFTESVPLAVWIFLILFILFVPYKIVFSWLVWKCYANRDVAESNFETL